MLVAALAKNPATISAQVLSTALLEHGVVVVVVRALLALSATVKNLLDCVLYRKQVPIKASSSTAVPNPASRAAVSSSGPVTMLVVALAENSTISTEVPSTALAEDVVELLVGVVVVVVALVPVKRIANRKKENVARVAKKVIQEIGALITKIRSNLKDEVQNESQMQTHFVDENISVGVLITKIRYHVSNEIQNESNANTFCVWKRFKGLFSTSP